MDNQNNIKYLYAFDLSLSNTGLSIFNLTTFSPVLVTSFKTNSQATIGVRLRGIEQEVLKLMKQYIPTEVVIEKGFSNNNIHATQQIFKVNGLIDCRFWAYPQTEIAPSHWKKVICGVGTATKERVKDLLESKYPDVKFKNTDESDSFALGLCYLIEKHNMSWSIFKPKKTKPTSKNKKTRTPD